MCDQVEILCTRVVTMGDPRPFTYLSPPFDSNIIGFNRYWAANEIRNKLKIYGNNCLLSPERLENFVIDELGLNAIDGQWTIKYGKFWKEYDGSNWVDISVFGTGNTMIGFELYIDDEDVINYINNLEGEYPIHGTTE